MLTLFRHIRKSLLGSGQARKSASSPVPSGTEGKVEMPASSNVERHVLSKVERYLLYATGEIALVVIGILIALQINNWNEWRKDKNKEFSYLTSLKDEFESNLKNTELNVIANTKFKNLSLILLKVYSNDTIVENSLLALAVEYLSYGGPTEVKDDAWQDLVSSGNTDLLSNSNLRFSISEYHNNTERHWRYHQNNWIDDHNNTHDLTSTILPWKDRNAVSESFISYISDQDFTYPEVSMAFDSIVIGLKNLPNIESLIFTMYHIHRRNISLDEQEISAIIDILKIIDFELDNYQYRL